MILKCSYDFRMTKRTFKTVLENSVNKTIYK